MKILDKAGINRASEINGVNLPVNNASNKGTEYGGQFPNVTPHREPSNSTTSEQYSDKVLNLLERATNGIDPVTHKTAYKDAVYGALNSIIDGLLGVNEKTFNW